MARAGVSHVGRQDDGHSILPIPKQIAEKLGLSEGDDVEIAQEEKTGRITITPRKKSAGTPKRL